MMPAAKSGLINTGWLKKFEVLNFKFVHSFQQEAIKIEKNICLNNMVVG